MLRDEVSRRHRSYRPLADLRDGLDLPHVTSAEAVADIVRPLIADARWIDALLADYLNAAAHDPFFRPPATSLKQDVFSGLVLFNHAKASISLSCVRSHDYAQRLRAGGPTSLSFTGRLTIYNFLRSGNARLSFWEAPAQLDPAGATRTHCVQCGTRTIVDQEMIELDGRKACFTIDAAERSLLILQAEIVPDAASLQFQYAAATGEPLGCSAVDPASSRVQLLATFLRHMDRADAIATLKSYFEHKDFFVRWYVMREALALDAPSVVPELERMAQSDPHHEVRGAASRTLPKVTAMLNAATEC